MIFNKDAFIFGDTATAVCTVDNSQGSETIEKMKLKLVRVAIYQHNNLFSNKTTLSDDVKFAESGGLRPGQKKDITLAITVDTPESSSYFSKRIANKPKNSVLAPMIKSPAPTAKGTYISVTYYLEF